MAKQSFISALLGTKSFDTSDLLFPESYHTCFTNQDNSLPFIRNTTRRNGKPALLLSAEDQSSLADPLKHTLICKFSARMPNFELIRKHIESLKLRGPWRLGSLDFRHVMLKLELEIDYAFLFTKKLHRIENVLVKFLKWTAEFDFRSEPPIAPVWIRFPDLKLHLFHKKVLFSLASVFGKPLKLDLLTSNLSRPSVARVLVEMDITFSYADEIWIGSNDEGYWQEVGIDSLPFYCARCRIFGHCLDNCFITNPHLRHINQSRDDNFVLNDRDFSALGGEDHVLTRDNQKLQPSTVQPTDFSGNYKVQNSQQNTAFVVPVTGHDLHVTGHVITAYVSTAPCAVSNLPNPIHPTVASTALHPGYELMGASTTANISALSAVVNEPNVNAALVNALGNSLAAEVNRPNLEDVSLKGAVFAKKVEYNSVQQDLIGLGITEAINQSNNGAILESTIEGRESTAYNTSIPSFKEAVLVKACNTVDDITTTIVNQHIKDKVDDSTDHGTFFCC